MNAHRNQPNPARPEHKFGPFFTNEGALNLDWVGEKAMRTSADICNARHGLTSTGLRNFYNEFLRIRDLPASHTAEKIVLIKLLVAKVQYKKTTGKVPDIFAHFIEQLVTEIGESIDRFEKSCLIMEALVGFNPKK